MESVKGVGRECLDKQFERGHLNIKGYREVFGKIDEALEYFCIGDLFMIEQRKPDGK